jgi:hypothetical protein
MEEFPQQKNTSETKEQKMRRLLGLRSFPKMTDDEKKKLLGSEERLEVLKRIKTITLPAGAKAEVKKGVVLEMIKSHLVSDEVLRNHPLVYIGSDTDIEYPLALGGRHIVMVDPVLADNEAIKEILVRIETIAKEKIPLGEDKQLSFDFDFGNGKEKVTVQIEARLYGGEGGYKLPANTGLIVLYASGVFSNEDKEMKSKLAPGGAILEETRLLTKDWNTGEEETTQFGEL